MNDLHLRLIHFLVQDAQSLEVFGAWWGTRKRVEMLTHNKRGGGL